MSEPTGKAALPPDERPSHAEVQYTLRPAHGDQIGLITQLVLGARPVILIHVGLSDDGEALAFDVDATGPKDPAELATTLELIAHVLRAGEPEEKEPSDG